MKEYTENTVAEEILNKLISNNETAWMKFKMDGHVISATLTNNNGNTFTVEFICGKNFVNMRLVTNVPVKQNDLSQTRECIKENPQATFVPFYTNDGLWGENAFIDTTVMNEKMDNILRDQLVPHINGVLNYISIAEKEGVAYA